MRRDQKKWAREVIRTVETAGEIPGELSLWKTPQGPEKRKLLKIIEAQ
jgi:hypothetical protein